MPVAAVWGQGERERGESKLEQPDDVGPMVSQKGDLFLFDVQWEASGRTKYSSDRILYTEHDSGRCVEWVTEEQK